MQIYSNKSLNLIQFQNKVLWNDQLEPEWWEEKKYAKWKEVTRSMPSHLMSMKLALLYLLTLWLLTKAAGWILTSTGQYHPLRFCQMLQNPLDSASHCRWTMTRAYSLKATQDFWRQKSGIFCDVRVDGRDLKLTEHASHFAEGKTNQNSPEQTGSKDNCRVKGTPGDKPSIWWYLWDSSNDLQSSIKNNNRIYRVCAIA